MFLGTYSGTYFYFNLIFNFIQGGLKKQGHETLFFYTHHTMPRDINLSALEGNYFYTEKRIYL